MERERDRYDIPKHWNWEWMAGISGAMGWSPGLLEFFYDDLELGGRVACAYDDEAEWGADGIILFMAAPGGPWEAA